jgi:type II secretory pathway component PulK
MRRAVRPRRAAKQAGGGSASASGPAAVRSVHAGRGGGRRGVVLLAVLVIVVVLALAAYQFSELMLAEYKSADSYARSVQARALAESGVYYAAVAMSSSDNVTNLLGGNPFANSAAFQGVLVRQSDTPRFQGRFSILSPLDPDLAAAGSAGFRFGITDESGKINLNALLRIDSSGQVAHDMLMLLPNMTEDVANAILDWIDPDDDTRSSGAESDYYSTLNPPYRCKNGPLDSLEELLFVRGVTPQLLFGNDRNRNGILDPDEDDGSGVLDRGWSAYLTVYSRERNLDSTGNPRININMSDLTTLQQQLSTALGNDDLVNYIIAYRMYGPAQTGGGGSGGAGGAGGGGGGGSTAPRAPQAPQAMTAPGGTRGTVTVAISSSGGQRGGNTRIASLYELINSSVSIPTSTTGGAQGAQQQTMTLQSPLNDQSTLQQLLPVLLDKTSTVADTELPARINVNTAPQAVLATLTGLTDADVQSIIDARPDFTADGETIDPIYQTPAWLITQAQLSPQTLKSMERYITATTQPSVFRVQALGHFDGGGPTARIEAVIDTNAGRPRIIYWRDLTELGKGFNLQPTGQ